MLDRDTQLEVEKIIDEKVSGYEMFTAYDVTVEARKRNLKVFHSEVKDVVHTVFQTGGMGIGYNRELVDLPGVAVQPFLYLPKWADASKYDPQPQPAAPPPCLLPPPAPTSKRTSITVNNGIAPVPTLGSTFITSWAPAVGPHNVTVTPGLIGDGLVGGCDISTCGCTGLPSTTVVPDLAAVDDGDDEITYSVDKRNRVCVPKKLIASLGLEPYDSAQVVSEPGKVRIRRFVTSAHNGTSRYYSVDKSTNIRLEQSVFAAAGISGTTYQIVSDGKEIVITKA